MTAEARPGASRPVLASRVKNPYSITTLYDSFRVVMLFQYVASGNDEIRRKARKSLYLHTLKAIHSI
jgi:hypothetical protein